MSCYGSKDQVLGTLILGILGPGARHPYFGYQDQGIPEWRTYGKVPRKEYRVQSIDYRIRNTKKYIKNIWIWICFPTI